jgi:hypothetical protein
VYLYALCAVLRIFLEKNSSGLEVRQNKKELGKFVPVIERKNNNKDIRQRQNGAKRLSGVTDEGG